jgi:hypothetical protein
MCRRIDCSECGRPTFAGCGAHVEQVLGDVPPDDRCRCRETKTRGVAPPADAARETWLRNIFGK